MRIGLRKSAAVRAVALAAAGAAAPAPGGVEQFELSIADALSAEGLEVDAAAGTIKNVSILSVGPATGHGFEIDETTLDTYLEAFNANAEHVVARLKHPEKDWTGASDGIEWLLGYPLNLRRDGQRILGDFQFTPAAKVSPNGDLWTYVTTLAGDKRMRRRCGVSVVAGFKFEEVTDGSGRVLRVAARTVWTKAVDFVGDPAANRNGLLSAQTPPPASPAAPGNPAMKIRQYLLALGLIQENATEVELKAALKKLSKPQKKVAAVLRDEELADDERNEMLSALGVKPDAPHELAAAAPAGATQTTLATPATPVAPAAPAAPATGTVLSTADIDARVTALMGAESTRVSTIRTLAATHALGDQWALDHIERRTTEAAAREDVLAQLAQRRGPIGGLGNGGVRVTAGDDGRVAFCAALSDAVLLRENLPIYEEAQLGAGLAADPSRPVVYVLGTDGRPKVRQAHAHAAGFVGLSLCEMGRQWLTMLGVNTVGMDHERIAKLCLNRMELAGYIGGVALSHSTSDFGGIYANVLNKMLLPAYEEEPSTWEAWAEEKEVKDFRPARLNQLGHIPAPPRVLEGAEYTHVTFGEKYEEIQAFKYGLLLALTWEMFVNDDLSAFTDGAFGFAQSAKALENDLMYAKLFANPTLNEDGVAVFHANHNNVDQGTAGAPSIARMDAMRKAMALQKGIAPKAGVNGRTLNLRANTLLVPIGLEAQTSQLITSTVKIGGTNNEPNYEFVRSLKIVSDSRLDDNSSTAWYSLAAKRRGAPAAVGAKLRGYKRPTIEKQNVFNGDGVTYKLRHVFGAAIPDYRPWQKNAGA